MAHLIYRSATNPVTPTETIVKGEPLTYLEGDGNLKALNDDIQLRATKASPVFTGTATFNSTTAIKVPVGLQSQRPTGVTGYIRYNTDTGQFEGYRASSWGPIGGGATGGGNDDVFYENSKVVTVSYSITSGKNAMTAGPVTILDGVSVTIPDGSTWTIV